MANKTFKIAMQDSEGRKFNVTLRADGDISRDALKRIATREVRRSLLDRKEDQPPAQREEPDAFPFRKQVRSFVKENVPGLAQFGTNVAIPTASTFAGAKAGLAIGTAAAPFTGGASIPIGGLIGGMVGGFGGEALLQESGLAERSKVGLVLSAASPIFGPLLSKTLIKGSQLARKIPGVEAAITRMQSDDILKQISGLAQKVIPRTAARNFFSALDRIQAKVNPFLMEKSTSTVNEILERITPELADAFPEAAGARGLALGIQKILKPSFVHKDGVTFANPVSLSELQDSMSLLGRMIQRTERAGGLKAGTSKRFWGAMAEDFDNIVASKGFSATGKTRGAINLLRKGNAAFKSGRAAEELDEIVIAAKSPIRGEEAGEQINVAAILKKVRALVNPKSKTFDKNFSEGLGDQKDSIISFLESANKFTSVRAGGVGPGSLVIRTRLAKLGEKVTGGIIGAATLGAFSGGPLALGMGAIAGSRLPETFAQALLKPGGRRFLLGMLKRGQRVIDIPLSVGRAQAASQALRRAPDVELPGGRSKPNFATTGPDFSGLLQ